MLGAGDVWTLHALPLPLLRSARHHQATHTLSTPHPPTPLAPAPGTEASHEHFRGDLNCSRGYEWGVVAAAKARNPAIKTFGLSWGAPGWIGGGNYYSDDNIRYHLDWVACAEGTWGFTPDYMGV